MREVKRKTKAGGASLTHLLSSHRKQKSWFPLVVGKHRTTDTKQQAKTIKQKLRIWPKRTGRSPKKDSNYVDKHQTSQKPKQN